MKNILLLIAALAVIGGVAGYLVYNKPFQDISKAEADFRMTAPELLAAFEAGEAAANARYLDKVIEVSGTVREVKKGESGGVSVTLDTGNDMSGVICELDQVYDAGQVNLAEGQPATLRGICTGMLFDVVLVRCVVVE